MNPEAQQFIFTEELYKLPGRVIVLLPVFWETVPEDQVVLLGKILSAARLSVQGVQVLSYKQVKLSQLAVFNPAVILSFGVSLTPSTALYQTETMEGIIIIQADELSALTDSKKKELWGALKKLIRS
jgi:hypothetical protein